MRRGAISKNKARLINFHATDILVEALDAAVRIMDLDRAKFIRAAIREKAARTGVRIKEAS